MATSGSTNYTVTAGQIVTEALRAIGLRVSDAADTFTTTTAMIANAALRLVGMRNPSTAAVYDVTTTTMVNRALRMIGVTNPTATQTTNATTAFSSLVQAWYQHGLTTSGGNYEAQWGDALAPALAIRIAPEFGKTVDQGLAALAESAFQNAKLNPLTPADTNIQTILGQLVDLWAQYGTLQSGGNFSNRWAQALTLRTAIQSAMENNRPIPQGLPELAQQAFAEARNFSKVDDGLRALNLMLKAWQQRGLQTWVRKTHNWTLTSGTASYAFNQTASPGLPVRIIGAFLRDDDGNDTPITLVSKADWFNISDKDSAGLPTQAYYEKNATTATFYVWPVTDQASHQMWIDYHRPIEDLDATTDDLDMPQGAYEAVKYGLAVRLAAQYDRKVPAEVAALSVKLEDELFETSAEFVELRVEPDLGW